MPTSHKLELLENLEQHNSYSKHALKVASKASSTNVNVQRGFIFPPLAMRVSATKHCSTKYI